MNRMFLASMAAFSLVLAVPAMAQGDADAGAAIGATSGGATGAVVGGLVGGPIGAIVGGFAGAVIGAEAGIETSTLDYVAATPVDPVYIDGALGVGYALPPDVVVYPVEGDPAHGYIYANGRVWIVDMASSTLVYSPGYVVNRSAADFAVANPVAPVNAQGDPVVGYVLPEGTVITPLPDDPYYGYVYIDDRPALIDPSSRTIVWIE